MNSMISDVALDLGIFALENETEISMRFVTIADASQDFTMEEQYRRAA